MINDWEREMYRRLDAAMRFRQELYEAAYKPFMAVAYNPNGEPSMGQQLRTYNVPEAEYLAFRTVRKLLADSFSKDGF